MIFLVMVGALFFVTAAEWETSAGKELGGGRRGLSWESRKLARNAGVVLAALAATSRTFGLEPRVGVQVRLINTYSVICAVVFVVKT